MTNQKTPLTLKLLKESGEYWPSKLSEFVKDDNISFTPEQMRDWSIASDDIVQVVAIYLQQTGCEYESRLMLAEILEPCAEIYAKYESTKPNVVRNIIEFLKDKVVDKIKMDAAWAAAWLLLGMLGMLLGMLLGLYTLFLL